jgi:hypothetical protein
VFRSPTCSFLALIMLAIIIFIILFRWGARGCASRHPGGPGRTPAAARMVKRDARVSNWYRCVLSAAESPHLILSSLTYVCIVYTHLPQLPGCSRAPKNVSPGPISLQFTVRTDSAVPARKFWGETSPVVAQKMTFTISLLTPSCHYIAQPFQCTLSIAV